MGLGASTHGLVGLVRAGLEVNLVLDALAEQECPSVEGDALQRGSRVVAAGDEHLEERRHGRQRAVAEHRRIGWNVAPAQHAEPDIGREVGDGGLGRVDLARVLGEEPDTGGVLPRCGQVEVDNGSEERVGHLDQDPRAVAGVGLRTQCAAVLELTERADAGGDDVVRRTALQVCDEVHAARVVFETRVVETLGYGKIRVLVEPMHGIPFLGATTEGLCRREMGRRWPNRLSDGD